MLYSMAYSCSKAHWMLPTLVGRIPGPLATRTRGFRSRTTRLLPSEGPSSLQAVAAGSNRLFIFLAGTIGNLYPYQLERFLAGVRDALGPGDAFLLYGDRRRIQRLEADPDFYILSQHAQSPPRQEKAPVSALIMGAVLATAEVHDAFMTGPEHMIELFHGYTYSGHPLAAAACIASTSRR